MAVIQDLPLELLHRIINLAFEDSLSLADMYARRRFLSGASLVARSWRQPAQAALVAEVVICDTKTYPEPFLYKPPASACSVRRLFFYCPAPKDLAMLPQCARLTSLDLDGLSVHGIAADFLTDDLLADLEQLALLIAMTGSPQLHLPALSLRKLEVAMAWVPSSVIEPLLDAAPHLTVLRLFPSTDNIHSLYTFVRLAPQLRHLGIISVGNSLTSELGAVVDFLRNFTSLTSLCLYGTAVEDLASFLRPLPNPLVLLETAQVVPVAGIYAHSSSFGYLTCILRDCKAVQRLQRWRLEWGEEPRNAEEQKQEWEAACSALGIELCDRRRRFTD